MEDLEGIRENSSRSGIHSWYFHQLQHFRTVEMRNLNILFGESLPF